MDSLDISGLLGPYASAWLMIASTDWDSHDTVKVWASDSQDNELVLLEEKDLDSSTEGQWQEVSTQLCPELCDRSVRIKFGAQTEDAQEVVFFDYLRIVAAAKTTPKPLC